MIISALLTAVGLNLLFTVLLFALYSILRKQPGNLSIYVPRLLASDGGTQTRAHFNIDNILPSVGWVRAAWQPSEEDLLASSGLDGVVFMRIFVFCLRVFSVAGILGILVLVPVNYLGDQLNNIDFSDLPNKSIDLFSISNVDDGSNRLWFHFSAAYVITAFVCYLLYNEYRYLSTKRLAHFMTSKPMPHHFTILVRGIPVHGGASISSTVERFFMDYYPSTYLSHVVVRQTSKLRHLINDAENAYRRLTHLKSIPRATQNGGSSAGTGGFLGLFRKKDPVILYTKKLEDLEENVRLHQSEVNMAGEEIPAAFVCFKSRFGAASCINMPQSDNPTEWVTEPAPEPRDVYWPFFSTSFMQRWISKFIVFVASIFLIIIFLLVAAFIQGLTYLEQLEIWLPFLKNILEIAVVSQLITGYLPSLFLHLLSSQIPPLMKLFSTMQGFIANSDIEKSACGKMLWFTIWSVFFANVLTGSVTSELQIFLDPKNIPAMLAVVVPGQASFFIAYVVTSWTSVSSELTQTMALLSHIFSCPCSRKESNGKINVPSISYHSEIPRILLFSLLGLTYFILAPIILPFILVYFCIGYIIYRNQLLFVYTPKYDTGGRFWPIVHNTTIFSLVLMHIILIGIFGLKKLPLASSLILPLPILTLLFNEYCNKRFLPVFRAYSAEALIKKDREGENNPEMTDFYEKLVTAYHDPALMPLRRSFTSNDRHSPLLS
ncbi:Early-responsive to dehydration stress protein (ERD4) [Rhynchospora pubera]|uniref:Early-responsive to dehydration stress protein (ERD4) n=1 Tax=Rhynchospora pubera TaxID=906938 RepID=A0AAV8F787_9POAL|nr:Early-responsive to dehydration stress protein (ERD4) [Rhynchospora pubera]